ncbi:hypothetical protein BDB01DRAFT_792430, partial [Pilobolus umbonatus]
SGGASDNCNRIASSSSLWKDNLSCLNNCTFFSISAIVSTVFLYLCSYHPTISFVLFVLPILDGLLITASFTGKDRASLIHSFTRNLSFILCVCTPILTLVSALAKGESCITSSFCFSLFFSLNAAEATGIRSDKDMVALLCILSFL